MMTENSAVQYKLNYDRDSVRAVHSKREPNCALHPAFRPLHSTFSISLPFLSVSLSLSLRLTTMSFFSLYSSSSTINIVISLMHVHLRHCEASSTPTFGPVQAIHPSLDLHQSRKGHIHLLKEYTNIHQNR